MNKVVEKVVDFNVSSLNDTQVDQWDELCNICSSLVDNAKISKEDARKILKEIRNEARG